MMLATGAHTGTGTWLLQRATAVLLAIVLPVLLWRVVMALPVDYPAWRAIFEPVWVRVSVLLAAAALALHAWVGMRDILMDYVGSTALRLVLYWVVIATLASSVAWLLVVVWQLA